MDDLVGLLIIGAIFGIGWLFNKIKESQQTAHTRPPAVKREDLPERTRQMLYGGEVQMAKPKQGQSLRPQQPRAVPPPAPAQHEAVPRPLPPRAARRTVVGGRPTQSPAVTSQGVAVPHVQPGNELTPHELQALRAQQAPPHRHEPGHELTPHELHALREQQHAAEQARHRSEARSPRQSKAVREQQQLAQQRQRLVQQTKRIEQTARQPEGTPPHAAAQPTPAPRRRWLDAPDDVRRGIVLAEILGPPKALR